MEKEPGVEIYIDQKTVSVEEFIQMYFEIQADLENANSCLSLYAKEKHDMECQIDELNKCISELESELRVKEDLFKIKNAISKEPCEESRPSIEWYECEMMKGLEEISRQKAIINNLIETIYLLRME